MLIRNMIELLNETARDVIEASPDEYLKNKTPYETLNMLVQDIKEVVEVSLHNGEIQ